MGKYFRFFPKISYGDSIALDMTARPVLTNTLLESSSGVLLNYVMQDGQRLDSLAWDYYKDSDYVWLIGLANKMVDVYYDVAIGLDDLNGMITEKYGAIVNATNEVPVYWRTNWREDVSIISTTEFDGLDETKKKYWQPTLNSAGDIISYSRKKEDLLASTNMTLSVTTTGDGDFQNDERLLIGGENACWVSWQGDDSIVVEHVQALDLIVKDAVLTGANSGSTRTIVKPTLLYQAIPDLEAEYWEMVMAYTYENELNESKRRIKLVDNRVSAEVVKQLKDSLGG